MNRPQTCKTCGYQTSDSVTEGLCLRCLLSLGLEEPDQEDLVGSLVDHYRIIGTLGMGGMGVVYRAEDVRLNRVVAIKFLTERSLTDQLAQKRFEREARAASQLNHPNICTIHDVGNFEGQPYLVMECIEGSSLRARIREGSLSSQEILKLSVQLLDALEAAHEAGLLHRDIKPSNIFVTSRGDAKILDFGLARPVSAGREEDVETWSDATSGRGVIGTLPYMAPEQFDGSGEDARTDLFALGCVFYEMATGKAAFVRDTPAATLKSVLDETPEPVGELNPAMPQAFNQVTARMLQKRAERRYESAAEARKDLELQAAYYRQASAMSSWRGRILMLFLVLCVLFLGIHTLNTYFEQREIESVAVLPFESLSGDSAKEYLALSMTDSLIQGLSPIGGLRVASWSSSDLFRDSGAEPVEIGRSMEVDAVIWGSVEQRGDEITVRAALVDVRTGKELSAREGTSSSKEFGNLQNGFILAFAGVLRGSLSSAEADRLVRRTPEDPEAFEVYSRALYLLRKRERTDLAVDYLKQTLELAPGNALANAYLSHAYLMQVAYENHRPRDVMPLARSAAQTALNENPNLPEALLALAMVKLSYDWDFAGAYELMSQSLESDPDLPTGLHWFGLYYAAMGDLETAHAMISRAKSLEPHSPVVITALGRISYYQRDYVEAMNQYRQVFLLEEGFAPGHLAAGLALLQLRQPEEALFQFRQGLQLGPEWSEIFDAFDSGISGRTERLNQALEQIRLESESKYLSPFYMAVLHTVLGRRDEAFEWLDKAIEDRSEYLVYLKVDPVFDPLRSDARFESALELIGLAD